MQEKKIKNSKQQFRIRLIETGQTLTGFAHSLNVSTTAIYRVLNGTLKSSKIQAAIDNLLKNK